VRKTILLVSASVGGFIEGPERELDIHGQRAAEEAELLSAR
jgi:hypothetical protein